HSLEWNWVLPGKTSRYGHAETLVHAPIAVVRAKVLDYGHYRDILPSRFKTSRVVRHAGDGAVDVYMQILVLHGMVTLLDVTRFGRVEQAPQWSEVIEGRMVPGEGNVEDMDVIWTMRAVGPEWTVLEMDLLLKPGIPAPQSAVDEELRDSARYAVDSMHDRAQGSRVVGVGP
ncbi:MAG: hypothetical protein ACREJ3_06215, partial [Polyangiaceae bacterium]